MEPRPATPSDAPELLRLAAMMYASMGVGVSGEEWRDNAAKFLAQRLGGDDVALFCVDDPAGGGNLVSCGGVAIIQRLPAPSTPTGRWGYVQWMATDPEYRRRGLASAVLRAIIEWLEARGVANVELHATPMGEPLYRSFGFGDPPSPELRRYGD